MEITEIESIPIAIPLENPVSFSTRTIEYRDHAITKVKTDEGVEGFGFSLGYESADLIADAVNNTLAPLIMGKDPRDTDKLWEQMWEGTIQVGRRGMFLRAISSIDIALWDIAAKAVETPLHKYLGAYRDSIPAYASGGYYREGKGLSGLREEMERYVDEGHDIVKIKVGKLSLSEEIDRVRTAREAIGPDRTLLLDANGAWSNSYDAVKACREFGEYDPYFIEEPAMPDKIDLLASINQQIDYPVATGELEATRYAFRTLIRENAADILQPDVTVIGGITEWMRVANLASAHDIPIAPHYNWNIHTPLLCAIENGSWIEYFYRDQEVKVFDDVIENPVRPEDGVLTPHSRPGHGFILDEDAVERFRGLPK